jgi:hypothetical protein
VLNWAPAAASPSRLALLVLSLGLLAGCASAARDTVPDHGSHPPKTKTTPDGGPVQRAHPQAIEPSTGDVPVASGGIDPVGDPSAHVVSLAEVRRELKIIQELHAVTPGQGFVFPIVPQSRRGRAPGSGSGR